MSIRQDIAEANHKLDALLSMAAKMQANGSVASGSEANEDTVNKWPSNMRLMLEKIIEGNLDRAAYSHHRITGLSKEESRAKIEAFIEGFKVKHGGDGKSPADKGHLMVAAVVALKEGRNIDSARHIRELTGLSPNGAMALASGLKEIIDTTED